jgi:hypothetical protein
MILKAGVPYRITLRFNIPLITLSLLRDFYNKANGDHSVAVLVASSQAQIAIVYEADQSLKVGQVLFKLGTKAPFSSAVIQNIASETLIR